MFKSFIKSAELTSTDGVHHNKEKYFENVERKPKKSEENVKTYEEQFIEDQLKDEENDTWRINMYKPSEDELQYRSSFEKTKVQEELEKLNEEKQMIDNFKKAQANLTVKKNPEPKQKYNSLELLSNNALTDSSPKQKNLPNLLLKIKKKPDTPIESLKPLPEANKIIGIKPTSKREQLGDEGIAKQKLARQSDTYRKEQGEGKNTLKKLLSAYDSD